MPSPSPASEHAALDPELLKLTQDILQAHKEEEDNQEKEETEETEDEENLNLNKPQEDQEKITVLVCTTTKSIYKYGG